MQFKFEKLIIWQKAMDFGEVIHTLSKSFPKDELYNISSQIRRAVDSIAFEENPELLADLIVQLDYSVRIDPTGREVNEA